METKRKTFLIWLVVLVLLIGSTSLILLSSKTGKTPGDGGGGQAGGGGQVGDGGQTQVQGGGNGKNMIIVSAKVNLAPADKPSEVQQVGNPPQKALIFRDVAITVELPGTGAAPHKESMMMIVESTGAMAFIFTPDKPVKPPAKANVTIERQGYKPLVFKDLDAVQSGDQITVNLPTVTFTK